jgi:dipeptidyl-peptidase-4
MKRSILISIILLAAATSVFGQNPFLTVAEKSDFQSTATHADVMAFIRQLKELSPLIKTEKIAVSVEGREIPLLIIADPMPASPADLVNDSRIVVYVQANIHAGEVQNILTSRSSMKKNHGRLVATSYAVDMLPECR